MEQCKCCDPEVGFLCKECSMEKHIYELQSENARLREALEFYSNLKKGSYSIVLMNVDKWGLRAREALNDLRKGGE